SRACRRRSIRAGAGSMHACCARGRSAPATRCACDDARRARLDLAQPRRAGERASPPRASGARRSPCQQRAICFDFGRDLQRRRQRAYGAPRRAPIAQPRGRRRVGGRDGGYRARLWHAAVLPLAVPHVEEAMTFPLEGGCDCKQLRYRMETKPLIVHCCHCRWCQRETGASFALNAMIESDRVTLLGAKPELVDTPSQSGMGQQIARRPKCRIARWSHYAGAGPLLSFVRVGTLDEPDRLPPEIHIFTASKQPWVVIPPGMPSMPEYYDREKY